MLKTTESLNNEMTYSFVYVGSIWKIKLAFMHIFRFPLQLIPAISRLRYGFIRIGCYAQSVRVDQLEEMSLPSKDVESAFFKPTMVSANKIC